MLAATLVQIDEPFLLAQCAEGRSESITLDWKQQLPGKADGDRVEFLKDVSAMANADGGDIVYGVVENKQGEADRLEPILSEPADAAVRRLTNILDALEPRLRVQAQVVDVGSGYVLVLRVPASFDGPHSARLPNQSTRRFVYRDGTRTSDMSYEQLRAAFDRTATLQRQAADFRRARLDVIRTGHTPRPLQDGPVCVLHVIPLSGLARRHSLDIAELFRSNRWAQLGMRSGYGGLDRRLNLEGGVAYLSGEGASPGYTQAFRDGCIEATLIGGEHGETGNGQTRRHLWTDYVADLYRNGFARALEELRTSGFEGPAVVAISMLRVADFGLATGNSFRRVTPAASSASPGELIVPEAWIEHLEIADVDDTIRPLMDTLWQAFDVPRCEYFDPQTGRFASRN